MIDSLISIATDVFEYVLLDRLTTGVGWRRAAFWLLSLLTFVVVVWWVGRLMHWW
ncbi:MAG: hypothetical protein JNK16_11765 [Phycisphaerales bacterium]|nr:hypothetical protein [Phycisphaerales bacterium]